MRPIFYEFPFSLAHEAFHPRKEIQHPEQRELRQNEIEAEIAQSSPSSKSNLRDTAAALRFQKR